MSGWVQIAKDIIKRSSEMAKAVCRFLWHVVVPLLPFRTVEKSRSDYSLSKNTNLNCKLLLSSVLGLTLPCIQYTVGKVVFFETIFVALRWKSLLDGVYVVEIYVKSTIINSLDFD